MSSSISADRARSAAPVNLTPPRFGEVSRSNSSLTLAALSGSISHSSLVMPFGNVASVSERWSRRSSSRRRTPSKSSSSRASRDRRSTESASSRCASTLSRAAALASCVAVTAEFGSPRPARIACRINGDRARGDRSGDRCQPGILRLPDLARLIGRSAASCGVEKYPPDSNGSRGLSAGNARGQFDELLRSAIPRSLCQAARTQLWRRSARDFSCDRRAAAAQETLGCRIELVDLEQRRLAQRRVRCDIDRKQLERVDHSAKRPHGIDDGGTRGCGLNVCRTSCSTACSIARSDALRGDSVRKAHPGRTRRKLDPCHDSIIDIRTYVR